MPAAIDSPRLNATSRSSVSLPLLSLASFVVGGAVMVVELIGARLLAPTFGASVVPWIAVIAAVLLGVAAGNAWGGRRSRSRAGRVLRRLLIAAGVAVILPLIVKDLPDLLLSGFGMVGGSLASAALLFLPASFLMGAVGPLVVKVGTTDLDQVGRRSGALNGANAAGAIAGTLVTGFVFVPLFPLSGILLSTGMTIVALAVILKPVESAT